MGKLILKGRLKLERFLLSGTKSGLRAVKKEIREIQRTGETTSGIGVLEIPDTSPLAIRVKLQRLKEIKKMSEKGIRARRIKVRKLERML